MTEQELKDIVAAVVAELEKSGVDFDYKADQAKDDDLVFVIRGTAPNYQGVTITWKGLLDIITAQATQAKNDAETAKNAANTILEQVQSKGTEITNFVATSKTEIETQKNESVNAVKSVYQTDLDELKGDLDGISKVTLPNLFNKNDETIEYGGYYEADHWSENSDLCMSGFIPIREGEIYSVGSVGNVARDKYFRFYDKDKKPLSYIYNPPIDATAPTGAYYFKFPLLISDIDNTVAFVGKVYDGTYYKDYEANNRILCNEVDTNRQNISSVLDIQSPFNLFNPNADDIRTGGFYTYDGVWNPYNDYSESGYIPCEKGNTIYAMNPTGNNNFYQSHITFWDSNKEFVTGIYNSSTDPFIIVPNNPNIKYFRFIIGNTEVTPIGEFLYAVIAFDPITSFVPYIEKTDSMRLMTMEKKISKIPSIEAKVDNIEVVNHWKDKKWYAYGTSITNIYNEGKYPTYLAQLSEMNLVCKGISGGGIGNLGSYSQGQVYNAICNITDGKLEADLITLETGANDVAENVPLGTIYDNGKSTLSGCLNDCIRYLQEKTNAQIAVIPSPAWTGEVPAESNKYYEWQMMVRDICFINKVHFIPACSNMGYAKLASSKGDMYIVDSIHQTELGGYVFAQSIWEDLKNIPCFYTELPTN